MSGKECGGFEMLIPGGSPFLYERCLKYIGNSALHLVRRACICEICETGLTAYVKVRNAPLSLVCFLG